MAFGSPPGPDFFVALLVERYRNRHDRRGVVRVVVSDATARLARPGAVSGQPGEIGERTMGHRDRWAVVFACVSAVLACVGVGSAGAATVKVCPSGCAFSQIAPAMAAANPGDTIKVGAGTYDGGFTIDKSLQLVGAGAGSTIISGGGPVITIGVAGAPTEPTVTIEGVTVTGGVAGSPTTGRSRSTTRSSAATAPRPRVA
jgi:hypothetical protein